MEIGASRSFVEKDEVWSQGLVTLATIAANCIETHGGYVRRGTMPLYARIGSSEHRCSDTASHLARKNDGLIEFSVTLFWKISQ